MNEELDHAIRKSLTSFAEIVLDGSWSGRREREAVSVYALGHLLAQVKDTGFLHHPTQICIEYPVPQIDLKDSESFSGRIVSKRQVCKDIVIWPRPMMTCWDDDGEPTIGPAAIIEWKYSQGSVHKRDVEWLCAFSLEHPGFVGYAVTANPPSSSFRLSCTRLSGGIIESEWLLIK